MIDFDVIRDTFVNVSSKTLAIGLEVIDSVEQLTYEIQDILNDEPEVTFQPD